VIKLIITILTFIIVFGILVFVHEFGHFIVAKKCGIMVREFSIGMGPKIFYYHHNETTYTIRILPLGGYVRMAGSYDDDNELSPGTPVILELNSKNEVVTINANQHSRVLTGMPIEVVKADLVHGLWIEGYSAGSDRVKHKFTVNHDALIVEKDGTKIQIAPEDVHFQNASVYKKILTNSAGIINNILLAIIAFMILAFLQGGVAKNDNSVMPLKTNSVARQAGITNGDKIIKVNNVKTNNWNELTNAIQSHPKQKINLAVIQHEQLKKVTLQTQQAKVNGRNVGVIGVQNDINKSIKAKLLYGFTETWSFTKRLASELWYMVSGHFSLNDLGGPVAIFANTSQAAKIGISGVVYFIAFLSINLAIMNLIPIPALDGGKILLNIVELIRRKPTSEKTETIVTLFGAVILIALMLLVTINDIQRYFM
jgi:regulator of sigma E protease